MKHLLTTRKLSVSGQEANREIMGVRVTVAIRLSSVSVRSTGLSPSGPFIPGRPGCSLSPTRVLLGLLPAKLLPPPCLLCRGSLRLLSFCQTSILCLLLFLESPQCLAHSFQPLTCTSVSKGLWLCSLSLLAPLLLSSLSYDSFPTSTLLSFRVISVFPLWLLAVLSDLVVPNWSAGLEWGLRISQEGNLSGQLLSLGHSAPHPP